ncbi:hypothetical protein Mapa_001321 [Marchantia paleacea]|nr:hypothetical protein Mapa_001321 [Marchantia paleacea]
MQKLRVIIEEPTQNCRGKCFTRRPHLCPSGGLAAKERHGIHTSLHATTSQREKAICRRRMGKGTMPIDEQKATGDERIIEATCGCRAVLGRRKVSGSRTTTEQKGAKGSAGSCKRVKVSGAAATKGMRC